MHQSLWQDGTWVVDHPRMLCHDLHCFSLTFISYTAECYETPQPGNCDNKITRYYFNLDLNVCKKLFYTGCGGNGNNFATKTECAEYCKVWPNAFYPFSSWFWLCKSFKWLIVYLHFPWVPWPLAWLITIICYLLGSWNWTFGCKAFPSKL